MKYLPLFAAAFFTFGIHAQTASTAAGTQSTVQTAPSSQVSGSTASQANAVVEGQKASAAQATNLSAELTRKVDTKNAKVGDEVVARTTSAAQLSDGTKLPKGTRLLGKVTDVQAKSAEQKESRLAFTFDRAVLRSGRTLPIHATVMSLSAPVSAAAMAENDDSMSAGPAPAPVATSAGGRASGGGLLGGGALRGAGSALGGVTSTAGNTLHTTTALGSQAVHQTTDTVREQVTNMPGVNFTSEAGASNSAELNAQGKNISLVTGTQMMLNVSASKQ
ncbi:MAG TPA: hypothetical protein VFA02_14855 [Pseudacidobacterium sp.]|nr:hypothetical protein [Pseudacidobacterium sp.]